MFLHVSVIMFRGGALGLCPGGSPSQGGLCPGGSLSRGVSVQGGLSPEGVSVLGGLCPGRSQSWGRSLCRGVSVQGDLCAGGLWGVSVPEGLSWGVCLGGLCPGGLSLGGLCPGGSLSRESLYRGLCPEGLCPGGVFVMETPRMVMSGRYASYWNAFLLDSKLPLMNLGIPGDESPLGPIFCIFMKIMVKIWLK